MSFVFYTVALWVECTVAWSVTVFSRSRRRGYRWFVARLMAMKWSIFRWYSGNYSRRCLRESICPPTNPNDAWAWLYAGESPDWNREQRTNLPQLYVGRLAPGSHFWQPRASRQQWVRLHSFILITIIFYHKNIFIKFHIIWKICPCLKCYYFIVYIIFKS